MGWMGLSLFLAGYLAEPSVGPAGAAPQRLVSRR